MKESQIRETAKGSSNRNLDVIVTEEKSGTQVTKEPVEIIVEPLSEYLPSRTQKMRSAALSGFGLGVLATVAYLLAGGHYFYFPFGCLWVDNFAFITFTLPGHFAVFDLRAPALLVKVACVLLVGLTWGLIAVLACRAWWVAHSETPSDPGR
jgi:hypothetical protein